MRLREIKKYGNSHMVLLVKSDLFDLNLKEGDAVDIDDLVKSELKPVAVKKVNKK